MLQLKIKTKFRHLNLSEMKMKFRYRKLRRHEKRRIRKPECILISFFFIVRFGRRRRKVDEQVEEEFLVDQCLKPVNSSL